MLSFKFDSSTAKDNGFVLKLYKIMLFHENFSPAAHSLVFLSLFLFIFQCIFKTFSTFLARSTFFQICQIIFRPRLENF